MTSVSYSDGTPAASFGYDAYGARNSMTDGEGGMTYSYNSYRQLESETRTFTALPGKSYVLSYTYNLADQLKSVNYNIVGGSFNKNVNYAYNTVGALSGVGTNLIGTDPNATTNVLNTVTFRASGALNRLHYGNGRRLTMGYNANRQQPTSMKVDRTDGTDPIVDYGYDYYGTDGLNNSRIKKITDNVDAAYTVDYKYDNYNRLIKAVGGGGGDYSYDAWGNITNFKGTTLSYATNASGAPATNRLASDSAGFTYSFDAAGNQTNAPGFTYVYDGANRLKTVNGGTATYGYDGDGMKARQTSGGNATYYVRSSMMGGAVIEVTSTSVSRAYVYEGGKLIAQQSYDGQFYWMHTDHLGSGHKMTDSTGAMKYRNEFDPFGQAVLQWAASGDVNINSKRFTGFERDTASGLDYANARVYNSGRGRFVQPDPAGLKAAKLKSPITLNLYSYVNNDPINFVDRTGKYAGYFGCILQNPDGFWREGTFNECYGLPNVPTYTPGVGLSGGSGIYGDALYNAIQKYQKRKDALDKARKALERAECADYIASQGWANPRALLDELDKNGQFVEQDKSNYWNRFSDGSVPAYTTGIGTGATVNLLTGLNEPPPSNGFRTSFYDKDRFAYDFATPGLDSDGHRALVFLHELSHATGKFSHPENSNRAEYEQVIDSMTLSKNIYEKCFK
jgi:RHS repeat-associated protein